jgi:hypothetical protein
MDGCDRPTKFRRGQIEIRLLVTLAKEIDTFLGYRRFPTNALSAEGRVSLGPVFQFLWKLEEIPPLL